jgi:hypothetical protein
MPQTVEPVEQPAATWEEVSKRGTWEQVHSSHESWEAVHPGGEAAYLAEQNRESEEG